MNFLKKALIIANAAVSATISVAIASTQTIVVAETVNTATSTYTFAKTTAPLWYQSIVGIIIFAFVFIVIQVILDKYYFKEPSKISLLLGKWMS